MKDKLTVVRDGVALSMVAHTVYDMSETRTSRANFPDLYYTVLREFVTTILVTQSLGINENFWSQPATRQLCKDLEGLLNPIHLPSTNLEQDIKDDGLIREGTKYHLRSLPDSIQVSAKQWKELVIMDFETWVMGDSCFKNPPKKADKVIFKKKSYLRDSELCAMIPEDVATLGAKWIAEKYPEYATKPAMSLVAEFVRRLIPTHVAIAWQYQRNCILQEAPTNYFPSGPRAQLIRTSAKDSDIKQIHRLIAPYCLDLFLDRMRGMTASQVSSKFFPTLAEFCLDPQGDLEKGMRKYLDHLLEIRNDQQAWGKEAERIKRELKKLRPDKNSDIIIPIPVSTKLFDPNLPQFTAQLPFRLLGSGALLRAFDKKFNPCWWIQETGSGRQDEAEEAMIKMRLGQMFPSTFGKLD